MIVWMVLLAGCILWVVLPRVGLLAHYRAWRATREREQVEDALKHLLNREHLGRHATPESLGGALGLPRAAVMRLIAKMEEQGLLETRGIELHLTAEGERWALHVVRAHRLWERYLADEARMPLERVHAEAHRREHMLTADQLDELEAAMGYPRRDPHGDPIPSREGILLNSVGTPLTAWPLDTPGRIVHLEDEPAIAYEQILAAGLHLGQTIRVLERTPQRLVLSDGENEYRLAPTVAANVNVAPLTEAEAARNHAMPLSELPLRQTAEVVAIDDTLQGFTRRRLLDLGLTPGAVVYPELQNAFADPRAYRVRGTLIALRQDQASRILVRPRSLN
ncbi:MAG: FeoA domain-containing protein [Roseiflexus sp.]|nr:FeoA domain-containing protein [Roseiflexus sp.]MDW8145820.1 iron dependent repressor, metal binding and dimerization domain protein [Roseiflexaceae bacterium]